MHDLSDDEVEQVAQLLPCSQCGQQISERACGPTHALLAARPEQHRLLHRLIEWAKQQGRDEVKAAVRRATWDQSWEHIPFRAGDPFIPVISISVIREVLDQFGEEPL